MKLTALAALLGLAHAANPVPIQAKTPGIQMGTAGGEVSIRLFLDALCPDSQATYMQWKELLGEPSPVAGKTYAELVDLKATPFVLPYHLHSYPLTQVYVYLDALCDSDATKCYQPAYAEYTWKNMVDIKQQKNVSKDDLVESWAEEISQQFAGVEADKIKDLFTKNDPYNSDHITRANWKYGTSIGVSGTPSAFINGVSADVPASKDDWDKLIKSLYATE